MDQAEAERKVFNLRKQADSYLRLGLTEAYQDALDIITQLQRAYHAAKGQGKEDENDTAA